MRQRLTDSFDHYSRYRYVIELREAAFGSEPIRLLDVGDPFGHVGELFPDDDTVSVDLFTEGPGPPGHRRVIGSGLELPFPDGSFDLVVSHDTYEHIPDDLRRGFVAELLRVGRGPVLVVAPFAEPGPGGRCRRWRSTGPAGCRRWPACSSTPAGSASRPTSTATSGWTSGWACGWSAATCSATAPPSR